MKMNETKYSEKIFAFLDILGFESIVNKSRNNPELVSKIANMLVHSKKVALSSLSAKLKVLQVNSNQYSYRAFSDMSVISGPYASHDDMSFLSMWIMFYQYFMWKEEQTFIRGAIVYGNIYEDKDVVFGPALIDAYHLERCKTKAVWPRVLIDKSLLDKTTETERRRDFLEFIRQDDANLVYLDYLRELFHLFVLAENKRITGERRQDFGEPTKLFTDHKETIFAQVRNTLKGKNQDEDKKILGKYIELSKYHNSTIDRLREVIKDLVNNNSLIHEYFDDQIKLDEAKKSGLPYEPKYGAEEHPEQSDMINILVAVINKIIANPPPDNLEIPGIVIIRRIANPPLDDAAVDRAIQTLYRETPRELTILDKALQESMIDVNSLSLDV